MTMWVAIATLQGSRQTKTTFLMLNVNKGSGHPIDT
jgi:hypothetical protein